MTTPEDGHLAREDGGRPPNRSGGADPDASLSDAIADAVKAGYKVLDENVQKGRTIAEEFREGRYGVDQVPGDIGVMSGKIVRLTRELAQLSAKILERLLQEGTAAAPSKGRLPLTLKVEGKHKAESPTDSLQRPAKSATPSDLTADPLVPRGPGGNSITDVTFQADISSGGLIATVKLPDDQAPGVYSGRVFVKADPEPLGLLVLKVLE
jgi:hypothetical protein